MIPHVFDTGQSCRKLSIRCFHFIPHHYVEQICISIVLLMAPAIEVTKLFAWFMCVTDNACDSSHVILDSVTRCSPVQTADLLLESQAMTCIL
jgi:hypothetical protein